MKISLVLLTKNERPGLEATYDRIPFGGFDISANQFGAQSSGPFDDGGILRGVTRRLFVFCQCFFEAPDCKFLIAPFSGLLCAFGIGAHRVVLKLKRKSRLRRNPRAKKQRQEQSGTWAERVHERQIG